MKIVKVKRSKNAKQRGNTIKVNTNFKESKQHPGGVIQVQRVDNAIRVDLGSEEFQQFKWEWMDLDTARWLRDTLNAALGVGNAS